MPLLWWILIAIIWIAIAFWPARVAGRKGHSFIGYFVFNLFFSRPRSSCLPRLRPHPWPA